MLPLPQHCTLPPHEAATLPLSSSPLPWLLPLQSPSPSPLSLPTPSPSPLPLPIAVAIGHCNCGCRRPSPLPSLLHRRQPLPSPLPSAIAVSHCRLHHCWPSQLPSPLAITVTVAISHFRELLPWRGKNCIRPIEAKNAHLILFCLDSGRHNDQSRMTDQVSSGNGQHQHWAASSKQ